MPAWHLRHQRPLQVVRQFLPRSKKIHREPHISFPTVPVKEKARARSTPCAHQLMTFLFIAIPLMILALSIAAVPLLVLTAREHRLRAIEVQAHRHDHHAGRP
jgi:hypothetical protein